MRPKSDYYVLRSTIYFSVPVDFVVFKIKFFFWVFSHTFDTVFSGFFSGFLSEYCNTGYDMVEDG